jgi:transposase
MIEKRSPATRPDSVLYSYQVISNTQGEVTLAEWCRREGIHTNMYYKWRTDFLEASKQRLTGIRSGMQTARK